MIWVASLKQAFLTLNVNRKLIGIALISVVFGKIIDLIEQVTDKTLYGLIAASVKTEVLQHALETAQTGRFDETLRIFNEGEYLNLEEPQFLMTVASSPDRCLPDRLLQRYRIGCPHSGFTHQEQLPVNRSHWLWTDVFQASTPLQGFILHSRWARGCSDGTGVILHLRNTRFSDLGMDSDFAVCATATCHLHQSPLTRHEVYRH